MESQALDIVAHTDVVTPTIDPADFDQLDKMAESFSISSEYLKFERPGDSQRVFWVGWTTFQSKQKDESTGQQKEIPAGVFLWRENKDSGIKRVIHGGSNLVRQLENIGYPGQKMPLKITFIGKKKANTNNFFDEFEVVVLENGKPAAPRTEQQQRNHDTMRGNDDLHSEEPFGESKPKVKGWRELLTETATEAKGYLMGASNTVGPDISAALSAARDLFKASNPTQDTIAKTMRQLNACINAAKAELQAA